MPPGDDLPSPAEWLGRPFDLGRDEPVEIIGETAAVMSPGAVMEISSKVRSQEVEMVILRACQACGGRTELRHLDGHPTAWCVTCDKAGVAHDIGVVNGSYDGRPFRALWWALFGSRTAAMRLARANAWHDKHA